MLALGTTIFVAIGLWMQQFKDPVYFFLLLCIVWASYFGYRSLKHSILQVLSFVVAVTSGFYGFLHYAMVDYNAFDALYSTFRLFILTVDPVFNETGTMFFSLPLPIEVARWSAAIYTISTIGQLLFRYFGQSVLGGWLRLRGGHIVILGYNANSSILVKNLKQEGYSLAVVVEHLSMEDREYLNNEGIAYFIGHYSNPIHYKKCGIKKCKYVILFHEDDSINLDYYISIKDFLNTHHTSKTPIKVLVHLHHVKSVQLYERLINKEPAAIKSRFFNSYQLIAEKMLSDYPLYKGYEEQLRTVDGNSLHLVFIGFGKLNQQIAYQALNRTHFITKQPLQISVLDRNIEQVKKEWESLAPNADKMAKMVFTKIDLSNESLRKVFHNRAFEGTHIFVSLKNDFLDMIEGLELAQIFPNAPVYIKMNDGLLISKWLHEHEEEFKYVQRYAYAREVLNSDYVLNEKLMTLAKNAHENYQQLREALNQEPLKSWDQLDLFKQESNRYQLLHESTKLMLIQLKKVALTDHTYKEVILTKNEFDKYIEPFIESLAEVEHERWNAFHYLRGWDTLYEVTPEQTKKEKEKLHGCLVSWQELDDVSLKAQVDYKSYDRDSIKNLYEYTLAQGYGLVKILT